MMTTVDIYSNLCVCVCSGYYKCMKNVHGKYKILFFIPPRLQLVENVYNVPQVFFPVLLLVIFIFLLILFHYTYTYAVNTIPLCYTALHTIFTSMCVYKCMCLCEVDRHFFSLSRNFCLVFQNSFDSSFFTDFWLKIYLII